MIANLLQKINTGKPIQKEVQLPEKITEHLVNWSFRVKVKKCL
jgi:hypothetical protein